MLFPIETTPQKEYNNMFSPAAIKILKEVIEETDVPNWDLAPVAVSAVSGFYISPSQCKSFYENEVKNRIEYDNLTRFGNLYQDCYNVYYTNQLRSRHKVIRQIQERRRLRSKVMVPRQPQKIPSTLTGNMWTPFVTSIDPPLNAVQIAASCAERKQEVQQFLLQAAKQSESKLSILTQTKDRKYCENNCKDGVTPMHVAGNHAEEVEKQKNQSSVGIMERIHLNENEAIGDGFAMEVSTQSVMQVAEQEKDQYQIQQQSTVTGADSLIPPECEAVIDSEAQLQRQDIMEAIHLIEKEAIGDGFAKEISTETVIQVAEQEEGQYQQEQSTVLGVDSLIPHQGLAITLSEVQL